MCVFSIKIAHGIFFSDTAIMAVLKPNRFKWVAIEATGECIFYLYLTLRIMSIRVNRLPFLSLFFVLFEAKYVHWLWWEIRTFPIQLDNLNIRQMVLHIIHVHIIHIHWSILMIEMNKYHVYISLGTFGNNSNFFFVASSSFMNERTNTLSQMITIHA